MIVITKLIGDTVNTLLVTDSFKEASDKFYSLVNDEINEYVYDSPNESVEMKNIDGNIIFKAEDNEHHTITLQAM